jgi:hypothetical protein
MGGDLENLDFGWGVGWVGGLIGRVGLAGWSGGLVWRVGEGLVWCGRYQASQVNDCI